MVRIGGRNKIINTLVNKYILYLMATATNEEFSKQFIPRKEHGKKNNNGNSTLSLEKR